MLVCIIEFNHGVEHWHRKCNTEAAKGIFDWDKSFSDYVDVATCKVFGLC